MSFDQWIPIHRQASEVCEAAKAALTFSKDTAADFPEAEHYNRILNRTIDSIFHFIDQNNLSTQVNEPEIERRFRDQGGVAGGFGTGVAGIGRKYSVVSLLALKINHFFEGEISYVEKVDFSLSLLNRKLFLLDDFRAKWITTFDNHTEPKIEQLGALHLFESGVLAFKASGPREATDLILDQQIQDSEDKLPLVMTEWKVANDMDDALEKIETAKRQCEIYEGGILKPLQLQKFRFVVVVSKLPLNIRRQDTAGSVTYLIRNVAINRANPSEEARRN